MIAQSELANAKERIADLEDELVRSREKEQTIEKLYAELDDANLFADVTTGLLIGGGVTLVTGVILIFALPGDAEVSQALIPGGFRF